MDIRHGDKNPVQHIFTFISNGKFSESFRFSFLVFFPLMSHKGIQIEKC